MPDFRQSRLPERAIVESLYCGFPRLSETQRAPAQADIVSL